MARLSLSCLGSFQAASDGKPLNGFESNKVRALLAFLAVEADRPHSREELTWLLWPDQSDPVGRANLRQALANLRRVLADDGSPAPYLLISRDSVQFNPEAPCQLDVREFTALLEACEKHLHRREMACKVCTQSLQQAAGLYRGHFL